MITTKLNLPLILTTVIVAFCINVYGYNNVLRFKITGNGYSDETIVRLLNGATDNFDASFDAWKLFSPNPNAPSIYTQISAGQELSINSLPEYSADKSVTIYTNIPASGNYTLEIQEVYAMGSGYQISLTDINAGVHHKIIGDTIMNFNFNSQQGMAAFNLNISTPINISTTNENCFGNNDGSVSVENMGNSDWTYEIIDTGNNTTVVSGSSSSTILNYLSMMPGAYLVRVSSLGIVDEEYFSINAAPYLTAEFELSNDTVYLSEGGVLNTTNNSQNASTYLWDFGNGVTSSSTNPSTTYNSIGVHNITLNTYLNNCIEQSTKSIVVLSAPSLTTAVDQVDKDEFMIENHGSGNYSLRFTELDVKRINLFDLSGKLIVSDITRDLDYNFSLNTLPKGMYIITVLFENNNMVSKKILR